MKGFREEISKTLQQIESKITAFPNGSEIPVGNNEWQGEIKRLGRHKALLSLPSRVENVLSSLSFAETSLEKLKFQSSDDVNDCVKYISAINDKLNQVELLHVNQNSFSE